MKTIYKYKIDYTGNIKMPKGAQVLCVQVQHNEPHLWALCEPDAEEEERHFDVYGTGWEIDRPGKYIGTFQLNDGSLVFHVFE
jgi:hypothetical protein